MGKAKKGKSFSTVCLRQHSDRMVFHAMGYIVDKPFSLSTHKRKTCRNKQLQPAGPLKPLDGMKFMVSSESLKEAITAS